MILLFFIFLAIGSYLNSLGYRLIHDEHFYKSRSFCPICKLDIAWYDNIPVFSWIALGGKCRHCKQPISWLYPCIELITPLFLIPLWYRINPIYFSAYFLFFIALIITIRTDFQAMLISRFATIYLIPAVLLAVFLKKLPIDLTASFMGIIFGYSLLWIVQQIAYKITGQHALGQGDLELLAFIGACTGPLGCWIALLVGSTVGSCISLLYMAIRQNKIHLVPLGAYLSIGAMIFVLFEPIFEQIYQCA